MPTLRRDIHAQRNLENAKYKLVYALILFGIGSLVHLFASSTLWLLLLGVPAVYLLLGGSLDWVAYRRLKTIGRTETLAPEEEDSDYVSLEIDTEEIGALRLLYPSDADDELKEFAKMTYGELSANKGHFVSAFLDFREKSAIDYPKYASYIRKLLPKRLIAVRVDDSNGFELMIEFDEEMSEVWDARYRNGKFSELIWV